MSDALLRDLERRCRSSASIEDQTAWVAARLRAGEELDWESYLQLTALNELVAAGYLLARLACGTVTQDQLALGSYCSHAPANIALGAAGQPDAASDSTNGSMVSWAEGLAAWGSRVCVRAGLSAASAALASLGSPPEGAERVLSEVRAWLDSRIPDPPSDLVPGDLLASVIFRPPGTEDPEALAIRACVHVALSTTAITSTERLGVDAPQHVRALEAAAMVLGDHVRSVVIETLVKHALGFDRPSSSPQQ